MDAKVEQLIADLRQAAEKATPEPWKLEKAAASKTGSVHYAIHTAYKPEAHPWSPRFIFFMCGGLGDSLPHRQPMNDYRDDPQVEADAELIILVRNNIRLLLDSIATLTRSEEQIRQDALNEAAEICDRYNPCALGSSMDSYVRRRMEGAAKAVASEIRRLASGKEDGNGTGK